MYIYEKKQSKVKKFFGILLLIKTNKNIKENILILSIIYFGGVIIGLIVDVII